MLTPQEVKSHAFQRASFGGYNMGQVDEFLDILTEDYTALLPEELRGREFSASDFAPYCKLRSRDVYSALNVLTAIGVITREQRGRSVIYRSLV